jgi:hypothetical protein
VSRLPFAPIWLAIGLATLAFAVVGTVSRPALYSDSAWGLLGWDAVRGWAFNHPVVPDAANISRDIVGFMTAWTPGQHVFPGALETLGLDLGLSCVLVATAFSIAGLVGWHALYRAFGFPPRTVVVALAVMVFSRFFNLPFTIYNGGEVLMFGVAPWFTLLVWRMRALPWRGVPALLAGSFVVFLAKLSGIVFAAAAVGAAALCGDQPWRQRDTARRIVVAALVIGVVGVTFYLAWFAHGWTAASGSPGAHTPSLAVSLAVAVSALWTASLSLGDLVAFLLLNPGRPVLTSIAEIYFALLPATLALLGWVTWSLRETHGEYLRFVGLLVVAMGAVVVATMVRGSVSLDERHFRILALLALVGIVHIVLGTPRRGLRLLFGVLVVGAGIYAVTSFIARAEANHHRPLGIRGLRHIIASAPVLDYIRAIDRVGPNGDIPLILVTSPDIGLEVRHSRVLSNHADFQSIPELRRQVYRGRVPRLYVLVQKALVANGKADVILQSFVDYRSDEWSSLPLGDFVAFKAS